MIAEITLTDVSQRNTCRRTNPSIAENGKMITRYCATKKVHEDIIEVKQEMKSYR